MTQTVNLFRILEILENAGSYDDLNEEQNAVVVEFETELWKPKVDELRKSMPPEEIKETIHDWWSDYEIADGTEDNLLAYVQSKKQEFLQNDGGNENAECCRNYQYYRKIMGSGFYWLPFRFMYRGICERKDDRNGYTNFRMWCEDNIDTIDEDALVEDIYEEVNYVADKLFEQKER